MSDHDLTHELCKSLDRHLAFPLLEFLSHRQLYDDADIQRAKIDLLQKTNMVDYAAEIYQALYNTEDIPDEMNTRRKAVVGKLKTLQVPCSSANIPIQHMIWKGSCEARPSRVRMIVIWVITGSIETTQWHED